jgi:bifunctional dihydroflavonol 4-reductase/flavanone 4-reductase
VHSIFRFNDIPDELEIIKFSRKKITDLGFKFKYSLEDMFTGAVETCREKSLLPEAEAVEIPVNGTKKK